MLVANLIAESKSCVPSRAYRISCRLIISLPFGYLGKPLTTQRLAPRPQTCQSSSGGPERDWPPPVPLAWAQGFATFMALASTDTRSRRPSLRLTLAEALAL